MNVLYTCDNNYVWLMGISTISLFENNKEIEELKVYLLGENITDECKSKLRDIGEKYNREVIIIDVPKLNVPQSLVSARWPVSAFTRLYSGQLLPEDMDRVLYMDCDTIVLGSIKELDNKRFDGNHIFYGIKDFIGSLYKKNIGLDGQNAYINAGVLLIDLKELRKINVSDAIQKYMEKYERLINYADQDLLNGMFHDKIDYLNPKFDVMTIVAAYSYQEIQTLKNPTNYYTEAEIRKALENPVIIHYTTSMKVVRPWFSNTDHPFAGEWKKYFDLSPWKNRKLGVMKFTSRESKIIGMIQILPQKLSYRVLGFIYSEIKPWVIARKAK
ncbi:MAG: glycosyltransferase family 8 protein [Clostridiales bacterium]|nr:glycosyltransferase family 8 protein [Clostridiales bacterium]